ncbi:Cell division protein FtsA [compost metagenome]
MLQVAQAELSASVRIAVPDYIGVRDPGFTSGVGILHNALRNYRVRNNAVVSNKKQPNRNIKANPASNQGKPQKPGMMERLKNMFSEFI